MVFYPAAATGDELAVAAISDFVCYAGVGGDGDREGGTFPFAAYHANLPTVRLDDRLANVEPNTRASYGLAAAVRAVELVKEIAHDIGGDADAVVLHLDSNKCTVLLCQDGYEPAFVAVFERVINDIAQHLRQAGAIGRNSGQRGGDIYRELATLGGGAQLHVIADDIVDAANRLFC